MWRVLRYRPLQALALFGLSSLITAFAVFTPLQDRAIKQESAAVRLERSTVQLTGIGLTSRSGLSNPALDPLALAALVPRPVRPYLAPAVAQASVGVAVAPGIAGTLVSTLRWRAGECAHVRFTRGRCPRGFREIAVSTADARIQDWRPGTRVQVVENIFDPSLVKATRPSIHTLRVVGVYAQPRSSYWFGGDATGRAGSAVDGHAQADDWLTARTTLDGPKATWVGRSYQLDLALRRDRVGVDQLLRIGPAVTRLATSAVASTQVDGHTVTPVVLVYSGLPDLAASTARDLGQVGRTVPLLGAQLGLLATVVLWLLLGATLDQRRPDLAVARLRGRGVAGARSLVLRELTTVVLAGVPVGCLLAVAASAWVRSAWLPIGTPFELRPPVLGALAVAVVVLVLSTVVATQLVVREPVHALLRRVPPRRSGWSVGLAEALVVAASAAAVAGLAAGDLQGPVAVAAPTLLSLGTGLVLGRLLVPLAATTGRRLLARGRLGGGVALLQVARGQSTRRVVAVLTVATALLVFSADALTVGSRNRADAAEQQLGAHVVGTVDGTDLGAVRAALHAVDPSGRRATVVTLASPPGEGGATTVGVVPEEFRRIALLPGASDSPAPWRRLRPPAVPAVDLVGTRVRFTMRSSAVPGGRTVGRTGGNRGRPTLQLRLVPDGSTASMVPVARIGDRIDARTGTSLETAVIPCAQGCRLTGLAVAPGPGADAGAAGQVSLSGMTVPGDTHDLLGPASHWVAVTRASGTVVPRSGSTARPLTLSYELGLQPVLLRHASVPARVPALVTGRLPVDATGNSFSGLDLQGVALAMTRVATLPRVPGAPRDTNVVDLDDLSAAAGAGGLTTIQVWFAGPDRAVVARVRQALRGRGVVLARTTTLPQVRRGYDETAAAWSLQLALLVGAVGLLIGSLVLLAVTATTWRVRSRDLAALRVSGVPSRVLGAVAVLVELVPASVAVLAGAGCGVLGGHLALPRVPLFATAPEVSSLDLHTAWGAVLLAFLVAAVVLLGLGLAAAAWLLRRTGPHRLQEAS